MNIKLNYEKTIEQNATEYYNTNKKMKQKIKGTEIGLQKIQEKQEQVKNKKIEKTEIIKKIEKKWYEKFHWGKTSNGFLIIGGRDAKTNEEIIKKYFEAGDKYFHADIYGAAHCVLKKEEKEFQKTDLEEAATFAGIYSKALEQKYSAIDVYSAEEEQVSKKAPSGESIGTGAFMIYGKREWYKKIPLEFSIGAIKEKEGWKIFAGDERSINKNCEYKWKIGLGEKTKNEIAKKIKEKIEKKIEQKIMIEQIQQAMPNGRFEIKE